VSMWPYFLSKFSLKNLKMWPHFDRLTTNLAKNVIFLTILLVWYYTRNDTQINDIHIKDTQNNDIRLNDTQPNET
jgi:hypothetical protein